MIEVSYLDTASFTEKTYREILNRLSAYRRERAERYAARESGYLSAGAGYLLDLALRRRGLTERDARYSFGEHGKPFIEGLSFSLSHGGTVAVLATADGEVGVDAERIASLKAGLTERVCTAREREYLLSLPEEERGRAFFRLWTAKESAGKYLGTGITEPKKFEIDLAEKKATHGGERLNVFFKEYPLEGYALTACGAEAFAPALIEIKADF